LVRRISAPPFVGALLNSAADDELQQAMLRNTEAAKFNSREVRLILRANTKARNIEFGTAILALSGQL
jgi:hypothetical protein